MKKPKVNGKNCSRIKESYSSNVVLHGGSNYSFFVFVEMKLLEMVKQNYQPSHGYIFLYNYDAGWFSFFEDFWLAFIAYFV